MQAVYQLMTLQIYYQLYCKITKMLAALDSSQWNLNNTFLKVSPIKTQMKNLAKLW
jgi:hypothetical protein